ncbi:amidase [Xanthobacter aminoxidans]|uniref:amidase n=1 Tax=Xanthobacter aminoxidans TaxID=186280 RepID=UPI002022E4BF|nr:amidase [Xanthobacter aminoxidans]MCL8382649.1 amidase [Xanthobacter aminoxidans]
MPVNDTLDAFVSHGHFELAPTSTGPLEGLTFALKDLFHVAGVPTAAGSPAWLASHGVPAENAPVVDMLLGAGARLVGKTHTDEMAWSLNGENHHYGTPINPAAPERIPGGSSSGSAAATAGGLVDFAIGSDTGGSVRLPASYCGLFGLRPTHGRIPIAGAVPLAPSYDTVGWFARDAQTFEKVGAVLLGDPVVPPAPRLLLARDLFEAAGPKVTAALAPALARMTALYGPAEAVDVAHGALPHWRNVFRILQSADAWAAHADWVRAAQPDFGPGVKERFAAAATLDPAEVAEARALRAQVRARIDALLGEDGILLLPTAPGIAPLRGTPLADLEAFRARAIELLCLSGHAGTPQISLPLSTLEGCPLGLSAMAPRGKDEMLLALAVAVARAR